MKSRTFSLRVSLFCVAVISFYFQTVSAQAFIPSDTPLPNQYVTDREVFTSLVHNNVLYIGGDFNTIGPYQARLETLNTTTGAQSTASVPSANNTVSVILSDGTGGWFVGGSFTAIGGLPRLRIAHILPDGSVNPDWIVEPNGTVSVMALSGGTLYFAGSFSTINGQARTKLAAVEADDGTLLPWAPVVSQGFASISAMAVDTVVYVGGSFSTGGTIGGQARNRIAALDASSGLATSWNPNASSTVTAIATGTSTVYVGGLFSTIGGASRSRIAELNKADNTATSWNPGSTTNVLQLEVLSDGTNVLARADGGGTTIGGQTRAYLAKINRSTGLADSWQIQANGYVSHFNLVGAHVYIVGQFTQINATPRKYAARVDLGSGSLSSWDPADFSANLTVVGANASNVLVGGNFTIVDGFARGGIAAFDSNLNLLPFNTNDFYTIYTMAASGNTLYIGGAWGLPNDNISAIDLITGNEDVTFAIDADNHVQSLHIQGSTLYAGGWFTTIGGQFRNRAAAINLLTNTVTAWNPDVDDTVYSILGDHTLGQVFIGGHFSEISGTPAAGLAMVDYTSGSSVVDFNADCAAFGLTKRGGDIVATGCFYTLDEVSRPGLSSVFGSFWADIGGGGWVVYPDAQNRLYVGGNLTSVNGEARGRAALFDASNNLTDWNPQFAATFSASAYTFSRIGNYLMVGGSFLTSSGSDSQYLAFFEEAPGGGATVPDAINDLVATAGDGQVSLVWSAPNDGGSAITDYVIQYGITSGGFPGNAVNFNDGTSTNTFVTVTGLVNGTEYSFHVAAVNGEGQAAYSNVDTATPAAAPPAPGSSSTVNISVEDFIAFSITNAAVGDEAAGDQPFGTGTEALNLSNQNAHTYAITGDYGSPLYTELQITTNSPEGYQVSLYAENTDTRTSTLLRSGGSPADSADHITDTVARLAASQAANDTLSPSTDTGIAFRLVRTGTTVDIYGSDEVIQWGDNDTTNALWASPSMGVARTIFSTTQFNSNTMTALINWFIGVGVSQRAGVYSGQVFLSASAN